jgi:branched-chain amino acid transport system ATP-binding protein
MNAPPRQVAPVLQLEGVHSYYGDSHILQGVSLAVAPGRVLTLLGRNGAGKTTLLKSIIGIVTPRAGRIVFAGAEISSLSPHRIARKGIGYVPETRGIFPSLSVLENLMLAARPPTDASGWTLERIYALFPRLAERRASGGATLSGGEQQMLSMARALLTNPRLLLLDEPTEGLAPLIVGEIETVLARLRGEGLAILLVEQNLSFALAFADEIAVLGKGQIRWTGSPRDFADSDAIKHTWLGL